MEERLKQQLEFILEMDKSKEVTRQTYLADGSRKENDAEHSWHLALMCMLLSEYANEKIDVLRTMEMVLIHDVIEIDAGDTYAYDPAGNVTKAEREQKAADRIFALLPEDQKQHMRGLWDEFERADTPEARFANTLDKVQPLLLNDATGGRSWEEHGVKAEQVYRRNEKTGDGSRVLWEYAKELIAKNEREGKLK
ncbi:MAG: HD domain-containing protein [Lachnospiraceae bacterium]|nr:HD domain-containing protein [Lachnospiraceae bacterium]